MGLFSKNKEDISRIDTEVIKTITFLEGKMDKIEQDLKSLRGLVNRKLGNGENNAVTDNNKYSDPFDNLRRNGIN